MEHNSAFKNGLSDRDIHSRMTNNNHKYTRREILNRGAAGIGLAAMAPLAPLMLTGCDSRTPELDPVKVGILHSQTGTMAISEISLVDMEIMAIEEINAAGGVLGRMIKPVIEDARSRSADIFPKKAAKLLLEDRVAAVFGCWTSSSRIAVLPVFEEHNGLLFYPLQYEGNECSRNVIYTGLAPNQQIIPAIDWLVSGKGGVEDASSCSARTMSTPEQLTTLSKSMPKNMAQRLSANSTLRWVNVITKP